MQAITCINTAIRMRTDKKVESTGVPIPALSRPPVVWMLVMGWR